jgi:D-sedoheptulose 7-phosphate isomerase
MKSELGGYVQSYLREAEAICTKLSQSEIERIVAGLVQLRADGGRLFILGVGGSAANASHAVNDFRKIANIESYTPTDNVSELTARINDDGWDQSYVRWLMGSRLRRGDAVLVFSVGGGDAERHVSNNLVESLRLAREVGAKIYGIVGRDGGFTAKVADACVIVPTVNHKTVTPHTEAFQAVVWHLIVSHPALAANEMKWESLTR